MKHQKGSALMMTMVMLIVLTGLGVSSLSSSSLEIALAGNVEEEFSHYQRAKSTVDVVLMENLIEIDNFSDKEEGYVEDVTEKISKSEGILFLNSHGNENIAVPKVELKLVDKDGACKTGESSHMACFLIEINVTNADSTHSVGMEISTFTIGSQSE